MKLGRNTELIEAFTVSSTDESRHCRNDYEYVDRVAMSTNKFYMSRSLEPTPILSVDRLAEFAYDPSEGNELHESGHLLSIADAAFVSFYDHCLSHFFESRILRSSYLIKAMGKALRETLSDNYVDILDSDVGCAYETIAYHRQIDRDRSNSMPEDFRNSLLDSLDRNEEELQAGRDLGRELLRDREARLLSLHDSTSYSQLLTRTIIPLVTSAVARDESERLCQFSFGIISLFEYVPPQMYFVEDIGDLRGKHIGHCLLPAARRLAPSILDSPSSGHGSRGGTKNRNGFPLPGRATAHAHKTRQELQDLRTAMEYKIVLSKGWRDALQDCPCSYEKTPIVECPRQRALYRMIRTILKWAPTTRRKVSNAHTRSYPAYRLLDTYNRLFFLTGGSN